MDQTWENAKEPSFGPDFGPFDQNLGPKSLCVDFTGIRC